MSIVQTHGTSMCARFHVIGTSNFFSFVPALATQKKMDTPHSTDQQFSHAYKQLQEARGRRIQLLVHLSSTKASEDDAHDSISSILRENPSYRKHARDADDENGMRKLHVLLGKKHMLHDQIVKSQILPGSELMRNFSFKPIDFGSTYNASCTSMHSAKCSVIATFKCRYNRECSLCSECRATFYDSEDNRAAMNNWFLHYHKLKCPSLVALLDMEHEYLEDETLQSIKDRVLQVDQWRKINVPGDLFDEGDTCNHSHTCKNKPTYVLIGHPRVFSCGYIHENGINLDVASPK